VWNRIQLLQLAHELFQIIGHQSRNCDGGGNKIRTRISKRRGEKCPYEKLLTNKKWEEGSGKFGMGKLVRIEECTVNKKIEAVPSPSPLCGTEVQIR
jgi:hypothetical protein